MTYDEFVVSVAKFCHCCPECEVSPPCDGVLAGGMCDHFRCTCGEPEYDEPYCDDEQEDAP